MTEYRGMLPPGGSITMAQWRMVMSVFHLAKRDVLQWLTEHRSAFSKAVAEYMEADVRELRLQRPPTPDYPDLAFRGIGLWTRPPGERPIIKLGGGFASLATHHPLRAKFELARLIVQTLSPCELRNSPIAHELPASGAWQTLLSCLVVQDENACQPGSFSEAGWAVSTAIAAVASPPGCTIPAFAPGASESCLDPLRSPNHRHWTAAREKSQARVPAASAATSSRQEGNSR
jgi:hypothetical protein